MNDRDALFARWMSQHGAGLRRIARSYARGAADQEDLVQDVALAIWNALPGFRGESSERTFVYRIAHLRGVTHLARRRLRGESTDEIDVADTRPGPESEARDREQVERLFAALRTLPVPQRQVLTLALEGLSHREIGECLGTPTDNVAVRLNRARAALRNHLEKP